MGTPYIGEIRLVGFDFAPVDWEFCEGQLLQIDEYAALYNLIGTTYGGDGQTVFALPDLRGRVPVHMGSGYFIGQTGGMETVALSGAQLPAHTHSTQACTGLGSSGSPQANLPAQTPLAFGNLYNANPADETTMNSQSIAPSGGSQPHDNMQPFLCVNYIISLFGIYPSEG